jgi:pyrroline-5-carboxylate reductase
MLHKETIAVIGATSERGKIIVEQLLHVPFRMLLMDEDVEKLEALQQRFALLNSEADIDIVQCCREASWEADIILIAKEQNSIEETAKKIKEVATTKIVIYLAADNNNQFDYLQRLLPDSKLVQVHLTKQNNDQRSSFTSGIWGTDTQATETVTRIFQSKGLMA